MRQNAFGGRAPPGPAGELERYPGPLAAIGVPTSKGEGMEGKREERRCEGEREEEKGRGGREGEGRLASHTILGPGQRLDECGRFAADVTFPR